MDPSDIQLIRHGFRQLATDAEGLAADFYVRLFEIAPDLRHLFATDLQSQGAKVLRALGRVVHSLDRMDTVFDDIRALGRRHTHYGVQPEHYASVGQALLETIERRLGPSFDAEAKAAWAGAYTILSYAMIAAGAEVDAASPLPVQNERPVRSAHAAASRCPMAETLTIETG